MVYSSYKTFNNNQPYNNNNFKAVFPIMKAFPISSTILPEYVYTTRYTVVEPFSCDEGSRPGPDVGNVVKLGTGQGLVYDGLGYPTLK